MPADASVQAEGAGAGRGFLARGEAERFAAFNVRDFTFSHHLGNDPRFTLKALCGLCTRLPDHPAFKFWQNGAVALDKGWAAGDGPRLSAVDTIDGIESNNSLVILKHVEQDPEYDDLMQGLLEEIYAAAPEDFRRDVVLGECLIFINSPNRKTAYHFDLEPSVLVQIVGDKTAHVWARGDPEITRQEELEAHCAGNHSAAVYRPERQEDARAHTLKPGLAVHFPSLAPHWVQTGPSAAVSINVNFDLRSVHHDLKHIHAFNARLRRLGLRPRAPGVDPVADAVKSRLQAGAAWARGRMRSMRGDAEAVYPVWRPQGRHGGA